MLSWRPIFSIVVLTTLTAPATAAPDEHILLDLTEQALGIMAGLFWDLGEMPRPLQKGN